MDEMDCSNDDLTKCSYKECGKIPIDYIDVPCCGIQICQEHLYDLFKEDQYECTYCKSRIENNNSIARKTIQAIENIHCEYYTLVKNPNIFIQNHFSNLRDQIEFQKDLLLKSIEYHSNEILNKLNQNELYYSKKYKTCKGLWFKYKIDNDTIQKNLKRWKFGLLFDQKFSEYYKFELESYFESLKSNVESVKSSVLEHKNLIFNKPMLPLGNYNIGWLEQYYSGSKIKILTNSKKDGIKVYNLSDGCCFLKHMDDDLIYSVKCLSSKMIITASRDKTIKIWDIFENKCIQVFNYKYRPFTLCVVNVEELEFISGDTVGRIARWNIKQYEPIKTIRAHDGKINSIKLIPKRREFITQTDHQIKIWDLVTNDCLKEILIHLKGYIILDNFKILGCSRDSIIEIDLNDFSKTELLKIEASEIIQLSAERVGVSETREPIFYILDIEKEMVVAKIEIGNSLIRNIVYLTDYLIGFSIDKKIKVMDINTLTFIQSIDCDKSLQDIQLLRD